MMRRGTVLLPVLVAIAFVVIGVGMFFRNSKKEESQNIVPDDTSTTVTSSPSPTVMPTLSPSNTPTKKPQPVVTKLPTASPTTNLGDCSRFNPDDGLATITINLKEKDNKPLLGDWTVTIKPTGNCPAILPYGNAPLTNVIHQYTYTYTTVGFHPGQVRVDVNYHYSGEGFDIDATSGNQTREVVVSN